MSLTAHYVLNLRKQKQKDAAPPSSPFPPAPKSSKNTTPIRRPTGYAQQQQQQKRKEATNGSHSDMAFDHHALVHSECRGDCRNRQQQQQQKQHGHQKHRHQSEGRAQVMVRCHQDGEKDTGSSSAGGDVAVPSSSGVGNHPTSLPVISLNTSMDAGPSAVESSGAPGGVAAVPPTGVCPHARPSPEVDLVKAERELIARFEWNNREVIMICLIMFLSSITLGLIIAHIQASRNMYKMQKELDESNLTIINYREMILERNITQKQESGHRQHKALVKSITNSRKAAKTQAQMAFSDLAVRVILGRRKLSEGKFKGGKKRRRHGRLSFTKSFIHHLRHKHGLRFRNTKRLLKARVKDTCLTEKCSQVRMQKYSSRTINHSISPCEDLHGHTCGKSKKAPWNVYDQLQNRVVREIFQYLKQSRESNPPSYLRYAQRHLHRCLNWSERQNEGRKPLRQVLHRLFQANNSSQSGGIMAHFQSPSTFANLLSVLHFQYGITTFFRASVVPCTWSPNCDAVLLSEDADAVELPLVPANQQLLTRLTGFVARASRNFQLHFLEQEEEMQLNATEMVDDLLEISTQLNQMRSLSTNEAPESQIRQIDFEQLSLLVPQIDWRQFLSPVNASQAPLMVSRTLTDGLATLLEKFNVKQLRNFLLWRMLWSWLPYLTYSDHKEYTQLRAHLQQDSPVSGAGEMWKECLESIDNPALSAVYLTRVHPSAAAETQNTVLPEIIHWIRKAWIAEINSAQNQHQQPQDAEYFIHKIRTLQIDSPTALLVNHSSPILQYHNILDSSLSYFEFTVNLRRRQITNAFNRLWNWSSQHISNRPDMDSSQVNAYYLRQRHLVQLPAAHLRWPFLLNGEPAQRRFAALGTLLAHEFYHAIDTEGGCYDINGTRAVTCRYYPSVSKRSCLLATWEKISRRKMSDLGWSNELMADYYGLRVAYNAYEMWASENGQTIQKSDVTDFFTHFAQTNCGSDLSELVSKTDHQIIRTHATWKDRVNTPSQMLTVFHKHFKCASTANKNNDLCGLHNNM